METGLNCAKEGEASGCAVSNLTEAFDIRDAIEGWELAGGGLETVVIASRALLLSELYMTATLVDGEFIVPVSDHPMAAYFVSGSATHISTVALTLTRVDHRGPRYCRRSCALFEYFDNLITRTLGGQVRTPAELPSPAWTSERRLWPRCF